MPNLHDQIRTHVIVSIINPARAAGRMSVTIKFIDVHKSLNLNNRMPAVCEVIDSGRFAKEAGVSMIDRTCPSTGGDGGVGF